LDLATFVGNPEVIQFLTDHNVPPSFTAAVLSNNLPAVSFFALSGHAPFNNLFPTAEGSVVLECSEFHGHYQVCHFLLERDCRSESWQSPLRISILSISV
jgi:hypothetical protein